MLAEAGLTVRDDVDQVCPTVFADVDSAVRAFMGFGPTQPAIERSGEERTADELRDALTPFTGGEDGITLPGWYRIAIAEG